MSTALIICLSIGAGFIGAGLSVLLSKGDDVHKGIKDFQKFGNAIERKRRG